MFDIDALQDLIAPDVFFLLAAWGLSYAVPLVANVSRLVSDPCVGRGIFSGARFSGLAG